jgi:hypothetical protein
VRKKLYRIGQTSRERNNQTDAKKNNREGQSIKTSTRGQTNDSEMRIGSNRKRLYRETIVVYRSDAEEKNIEDCLSDTTANFFRFR